MPHIPLKPIGAPRAKVLDDEAFEATRAAIAALEASLRARRDEVRSGWGPGYVARVHQKGKLTARERVARLADPGSRTYELGVFVNEGSRFGKLTSPAAGVITALLRIEGRLCVVIANDNTVASGAWWPRTPEKIERAQEIARRLRLPAVYLVDCSGLYLPEQSKSFAGARGAGHIFKMNSLLSAEGVPQIAGVFGDSIAGGGYMPLISDRVYMTEQAYMVIAGAALIKGAKSQKITSLDIGGPEVHVHASGCADVRVPDDDTLLACIRREIARLPSSAAGYYRAGGEPIEPAYSPRELEGLLPVDHREAYDAEQVLARLCDQSLFWEVLPDRGREMICGVGRVGGLYAGLVINRQGLLEDPDHPGEKRIGGSLYRGGIAKVSAFSRACNDDGLPLVWLQDISGFDIGAEAERSGLLAYGSSLIYANSTNTTPMFTVLLRRASGAGYYAMAGLPYDPVVQLSTCLSRLSVMEGRTLAIATYNTKLDDDFGIVAADQDEREAIERGMREVEARIERDMDPLVAARQMDTDEVVDLSELRDWVATLVEASYQSIGHRRVKNPRIWSLHDLAALASAAPPMGDEATALPAGVRALDDGTIELVAPSVGYHVGAPPEGAIVAPGSSVGALEVLGRARALVAPEGAFGRVLEAPRRGRRPVSYGEALLRLDPAGFAGAAAALFADASSASAEHVFRTPMAGRFYARPAPGKPPFVEVGQEVELGRTVALIEIMKTFNRLPYGGEAIPARCRIVELLVADGEDVEAGQALFRYEPA